MTSAIKAIGSRRATIDNKRFAIACGLLFAIPTDRKVIPELDATYAAVGGELFKVRDGESCAQALARCKAEYAERDRNSFYR